MNLILTIIVTLFIFGALIAIHELGHYLVARFFKVGIREYSIGMGPKIFQKQGKCNKFTLRALPIGGYVDMVGEASDDDGSAPEDAGKAPLNSKPVWQRILVVLAGPAMNIMLGLLIMAILVLFQGEIYGTTVDIFDVNAVSNHRLLYVTEDDGGLQKDDIIFAVDGHLAETYGDGAAFIKAHPTAKELIIIRRNSGTILNPIEYDKIDLSALTLSYDKESKLFTVDKDLGDFKKGDIIYTVDGTDITKKDFDTAEKLCAAYPKTYKVGVVREYKIYTEPEYFEHSYESFSGFPLYSRDGVLSFNMDFGDVKKNAQLLKVNGEEIDPAMTPDEFAKKYAGKGGNITVKYNWHFYMANPIVLKDVDLSKLSLAVSDALEEGDEICKVGSYASRVYTDLSYGVFNEGVGPAKLKVIRDGKKITLNNVLFHNMNQQGVTCGYVDFYTKQEQKTFGTVAYNAVFQPVSSLTMTVDSIIQTFKGKYGIDALSGPVGIGAQVGDAIEAMDSGAGGGIEYLFTLMVLISLSLGVCNLLPLPVLDGGRFVLYAIEGIRGKPLPAKVEQALMAISWVLVMGLMVFVLFKDIWKLV
ncbi:MAG: site-2 protease family protein [Clostridia bacterium]|nr:site-2 protease family protein [Clostridia bacterium]